MKKGELFAYTIESESNSHLKNYSLYIEDYELRNEQLYVLCHNEDEYLIVNIYVNHKGYFIHQRIGVYDTIKEASIAFKEKQQSSNHYSDAYNLQYFDRFK